MGCAQHHRPVLWTDGLLLGRPRGPLPRARQPARPPPPISRTPGRRPESRTPPATRPPSSGPAKIADASYAPETRQSPVLGVPAEWPPARYVWRENIPQGCTDPPTLGGRHSLATDRRPPAGRKIPARTQANLPTAWRAFSPTPPHHHSPRAHRPAKCRSRPRLGPRPTRTVRYLERAGEQRQGRAIAGPGRPTGSGAGAYTDKNKFTTTSCFPLRHFVNPLTKWTLDRKAQDLSFEI